MRLTGRRDSQGDDEPVGAARDAIPCRARRGGVAVAFPHAPRLLQLQQHLHCRHRGEAGGEEGEGGGTPYWRCCCFPKRPTPPSAAAAPSLPAQARFSRPGRAHRPVSPGLDGRTGPFLQAWTGAQARFSRPGRAHRPVSPGLDGRTGPFLQAWTGAQARFSRPGRAHRPVSPGLDRPRRGITRALEGDLAAAARSGASRDARADDAVCAQAANERVGARGEAMGDARGNESAGATCGDIDRREINPFGSSWSGENRNRVSVSISQFGDRVSVNPAGDSASHASMRPINAATMTPDGGAADGAASIDGRCDPRGDVLTMAPDGGAAEGVATRPVDASTMAAEGAASIDGRCDSRDDDGAGWRRDGEAAKRANSLSVALRNAATVEVSAGRDGKLVTLTCEVQCSEGTVRGAARGAGRGASSLPPPSSRTSCLPLLRFSLPSQCSQCPSPTTAPDTLNSPFARNASNAPNSPSAPTAPFAPSLLRSHINPSAPASFFSTLPSLTLFHVHHPYPPLPTRHHMPCQQHLDLTASDDLQCTNLMCPKVRCGGARWGEVGRGRAMWRVGGLCCTNLMCPKVTEPCICRLGVALSRLPRLTSLTLAHNGLEALPESLSSLTSLRHLDLSHNRLSSPPFDLTSALPHLKSLVLSGNPCAPSTPSHAPPLQKSNEDQ
ncbi:unnamed protein product [Closterium sp. NIES-64]|nr:unnamed protein product [Closterium sp. NIES-64]